MAVLTRTPYIQIPKSNPGLPVEITIYDTLVTSSPLSPEDIKLELPGKPKILTFSVQIRSLPEYSIGALISETQTESEKIPTTPGKTSVPVPTNSGKTDKNDIRPGEFILDKTKVAHLCRNILLSKIRAWAITSVEIEFNSSQFMNEIVALRVSHLPVIRDPSVKVEDDVIVNFALEIEEVDTFTTIVSDALETETEGFSIMPGIQVIKLAEKQSLRLTATAVSGIAESHIRFTSVSTVTYREDPVEEGKFLFKAVLVENLTATEIIRQLIANLQNYYKNGRVNFVPANASSPGGERIVLPAVVPDVASSSSSEEEEED
jgi:hypothetical protein